MTSETSRLIEAHLAAERVLEADSRATDTVLTGREATPEEMEAERRSVDAWNAAMQALCAHAPDTLDEAELKADYLSEFPQGADFTDADIAALLRSVAASARVAVDDDAERDVQLIVEWAARMSARHRRLLLDLAREIVPDQEGAV